MKETADNNLRQVGGLLLAAGGSSRMGQPKQLLVYKGKTLLRRAAEELTDSECDSVVVLGAEFERAKAEIEDLNVNIVLNENWQAGMSSSIKTGLEYLLQIQPEISAAVITLCDQPNITSSHINQLVTKFGETGSEIVAAEYSNAAGVPALFGKRFFDQLLRLQGDKGARDLIKANKTVLSTIPMPEAEFDIDTPLSQGRS